jgi:hypothetical protein
MLVGDEGEESRSALDKLISKNNLDTLRIAEGKNWQSRFGLSERIPVTLVMAEGRVRIIHDGVLPDPVSFLEADLKALRMR